LERPVFLREQANNLYTILPYFLTKNAIELPPAFITPAIQMVIMYWGIGYDHFFEVYLAAMLVA
jgi:hypothetical protein